MKLNEHLSKTLLAEAGISVPFGTSVRPEDTRGFTLNRPFPWVVKSQVLAGGRGKAGGVKPVNSPEEFAAQAKLILDLEIRGEKPPYLRVEEACPAAHEFYVSFAVNRRRERLVLTVGRQGGMEVENASSAGADNLLIQEIHPLSGLKGFQIARAFFHLAKPKEAFAGFAELLRRLYAAVKDYGLILAEINPLVITEDGRWLALDGKIEIDENFASLRSDFGRFFEPAHHRPEELRAREAGLSFHKLSGRIGMMVNGAGLAMATMDYLNYSGLSAANFLDLGGGADAGRMKEALDILFGDGDVSVVFINIFGGILSAEKVARAIAQALNGLEPAKPVVLRLAGNGAEAGRGIIAALNLETVHICENMDGAMEVLKKLGGPADMPAYDPSIPDGRVSANVSVRSRRSRAVSQRPPFIANAETGVIVQGITGREGGLHTRLMLEYGTRIVAGVTPFKGGQTSHDLPVYNTVAGAMRRHEVGASIIFVPAAFAPEAILEAAHAGVPLIVCITEGIPQAAMLEVLEEIKDMPCRLIGPNTPGVIVPGKTKIGIMPGHVFSPGRVAVFSRSGTLTYESVYRLTKAGIGQSFCVGMGGDPFVGESYIDLCEIARSDPETDAVLILGEIGGSAEEEVADYVRSGHLGKPVAAFIAGRTAPPGKRLGHAGAILEGEHSISEKLMALRAAGIAVCPDLRSIPAVVGKLLRP